MPRASEWDVAELCPRSCVFLLLSVHKVISLFDKTASYFFHLSESRLEATNFLFEEDTDTHSPDLESLPPWIYCTAPLTFKCSNHEYSSWHILGLSMSSCVCSAASVRRGLWINAWHLLFVRHLTCLAFFCVTYKIPPQTFAAKKTYILLPSRYCIIIASTMSAIWTSERKTEHHDVLQFLGFFAVFLEPKFHAPVSASERIDNLKFSFFVSILGKLK